MLLNPGQGFIDVPSQIRSQVEADGPAVAAVDGAHHAGGHRLSGRLDGQRSAHRRVHPHRAHHEVHAMHLQLVGSQLGHRYETMTQSFFKF